MQEKTIMIFVNKVLLFTATYFAIRIAFGDGSEQ